MSQLYDRQQDRRPLPSVSMMRSVRAQLAFIDSRPPRVVLWGGRDRDVQFGSLRDRQRQRALADWLRVYTEQVRRMQQAFARLQQACEEVARLT